MADRLAQRKCHNLADSGAEIVISGNAGCSLQLQAQFKQNKQLLPVVHPMDLLDLSYREQPLPF